MKRKFYMLFVLFLSCHGIATAQIPEWHEEKDNGVFPVEFFSDTADVKKAIQRYLNRHRGGGLEFECKFVLMESDDGEGVTVIPELVCVTANASELEDIDDLIIIKPTHVNVFFATEKCLAALPRLTSCKTLTLGSKKTIVAEDGEKKNVMIENSDLAFLQKMSQIKELRISWCIGRLFYLTKEGIEHISYLKELEELYAYGMEINALEDTCKKLPLLKQLGVTYLIHENALLNYPEDFDFSPIAHCLHNSELTKVYLGNVPPLDWNSLKILASKKKSWKDTSPRDMGFTTEIINVPDADPGGRVRQYTFVGANVASPEDLRKFYQVSKNVILRINPEDEDTDWLQDGVTVEERMSGNFLDFHD